MRGIVIKEHRLDPLAPGALPVDGDLAAPEPGPGQVLVRVRACGINRLDLGLGLGPARGILPRVPGMEISGEVAAVGEEVLAWEEGEEVLINPTLSCGECSACDGARSLTECKEYGFVGLTQNGGHAEYVVVPARNLHRLPRGLSLSEAAAVPIGFITAWRLLQGRQRVKGDESVLILGASGSVGTAAVQVARLAGCRVFALATSDWKAQELKSLGANRVIRRDHGDGSWTKEVLRATQDRGVDIAIDPVGPASWGDLMKVMAQGGRLMSCGTRTGPTAAINLKRLHEREISIIGTSPGGKEELSRILALMAMGHLKPIVDRVLPLDRAEEAYSLLGSEGLFGKVVLKP